MSDASTLDDLVARGVLLLNDGYRTRTDQLGIPGIPILRVADVMDGHIQASDKDHIRDEYRPKMGAKISQAGDVLITTKGTVGRVAEVPRGFPPHAYSPQLCFLRSTDSATLDPGWLYQWARSPQMLTQLGLVKDQTDMAPYVSLTDLRRVEIEVPEPYEQRRIAGVLGALDDLIETNRQLCQEALDLARVTYERAVDASDVEVTLGECGRWLSGGTPSTSNSTYWGGDIPWISASSLHSFFLTSSDRQVTSQGAANGTRLVPAGSILFVVRGMSLKSEFRVGIAQREVAFGQDCKAIMLSDHLPKATIAVGLLAASDAVLDMVDEASHGTGRLQSDRIEALPIRLPSVQQEAAVESALSTLLAAGAAAEDEIAELTRTRDELLPLLMSGRVRVREVA